MNEHRPTTQQLAQACDRLRELWPFVEQAIQLIRVLLSPGPPSPPGDSQPPSASVLPPLELSLLDAAWANLGPRRGERPHQRVTLMQYLQFADDFSDEVWEVIYLRFRENKPVEEIAELLGRHVGSVYRTLAAAKRQKDELLRARRREAPPARESS
jgi:DNA-directed RNA polymerase specialized sigma24 family protein